MSYVFEKNHVFFEACFFFDFDAFFGRCRRWQVGLSGLQNQQRFEQGFITPVPPKGGAGNLKGGALLPPALFGNLQIELVLAEIQKSLNTEIAKKKNIL